MELKNQIEYNGGALVTIKSVIYDVEDTDLYTFYLSPTANITDIAGMTTANDFLRIVVRNPKGAVDTATNPFEIAYKDISVKKQTMTDVTTVKLSADIVAETSFLNLSVEVELKTGKKMLVRYNAVCAEAVPQPLTNQFDLNKTITAIGSVVEWKNPTSGLTTYYFYTESDIKEPAGEGVAPMEISFADGIATTDVDLATADPEKVKIVCGAFKNVSGTTGKLSIVKNKNNTLTVSMDAKGSGSRLRAAYTGAFASGYVSNDLLKVTNGEDVNSADLLKVFCFKGDLMNDFAFGLQSATEVADLKKGKYAVKLSLSDINIGKTIDMATEASKCPLQVYDYTNYKTYDTEKESGAGITGTVTTMGTSSRMYLRISITLPSGPKVEGEWFGDVTSVNAAFDIVPVKPFVPYYQITTEDGQTVKLNKTILTMEVRMVKNYSYRGRNYGDVYFIYFRPDGSTTNCPADNSFKYPFFTISAACPTTENFSLSEEGTTWHWDFKFSQNEYMLQYADGGYSDKANSYGFCPANATATVIRNADKTWKVVFKAKEFGKTSYGFESGSKNNIIVEWQGRATKYTGTSQNDFTDADY